MGSIYPFPQRFGISSDFRDHKIPNPKYPGREKEPGNDYLTPYKTPIYAVYDNTYVDKWVNGYGTVYLVQLKSGTNERLDFIHAIVPKSGFIAKAGDIVGYTDGLSDKPARSSGPHVLVTYRKDWKNRKTDFEDCKPFFDSLPLKNNNSNSNNMSDVNFITVQAGEGLFSVASRAGLPANADGAKQIYDLNPGFRGAKDWKSLNARMGAGDKLKIKSVEAAPVVVIPPVEVVVNNDKEITDLKKQLEDIQKKSDAKIDELGKTYETKINKLLDERVRNQKAFADLQAKDQSTIDEIEKLKKEMKIDLGITNSEVVAIASTILNETISGSGILAKWDTFVEKHFKSNTLKSILKYDIFNLIGWVLSLPTLGVWLSNSGASTQISIYLRFLLPSITEQGVTAVLVGVAGIIVKLLLTRYDTNKDGKLNISDTKVLQNYVSIENPDNLG